MVHTTRIRVALPSNSTLRFDYNKTRKQSYGAVTLCGLVFQLNSDCSRIMQPIHILQLRLRIEPKGIQDGLFPVHSQLLRES